jgi:uncharacterized protein (TIGR02246 family)
MDQGRLAAWVAGYEQAWRTAGTAGLAELFADDAVYLTTPYAEPVRGLAAIEKFWEAERESPDEPFTMTSEVVAEQGDRGVARVEVVYGDPSGQEYLDLWVVTFDDAGRAARFEEWPFFREQPRVATD